MLGSSRNWTSLSRMIQRKTGQPVLVLDARNHGSSPKVGPLTYHDMAADLKKFIIDHSLRDITLIGHSLGGRTALLLSLLDPLEIDLVAVDCSIAHKTTKGGIQRMNTFLQGLEQVDFQRIPKVARFSEAKTNVDKQLGTLIDNPDLRSWLLMNLVKNLEGSYSWCFDVGLFRDSFERYLTAVPNLDELGTSDGPTLFLGGDNSNYIPKDEHWKIRRFFPNAKFEYVSNAGHFVHSDNPDEFLDKLLAFLEEL
eukprot:snap_masked-scaffold132_size323655-processed-gene-2.1 protein:Tk07906 transcript:snap_masked-scaffold132_size323655-processed-gene-2.1-mRNA-1 annotation:"valacyclovir hydrolase "